MRVSLNASLHSLAVTKKMISKKENKNIHHFKWQAPRAPFYFNLVWKCSFCFRYHRNSDAEWQMESNRSGVEMKLKDTTSHHHHHHHHPMHTYSTNTFIAARSYLQFCICYGVIVCVCVRKALDAGTPCENRSNIFDHMFTCTIVENLLSLLRFKCPFYVGNIVYFCSFSWAFIGRFGI